MKLPSFQFYVGDWRKDTGVQALGFFDRGVLFEILCLMHECEQRGKLVLNGRPMPEEALSRLLGLDRQLLSKTLGVLFDFGVLSREEETQIIYSRRMVRDEEIRKIRQNSGKQGGNPVLVKQNLTKTKTDLIYHSNQKHEGEDEDSESPPGMGCKGKPLSREELIYAEYPRKVAKPGALRAIKKALVRIDFETLLNRTKAYSVARNGDVQFTPHPATWFNDERYNDDPSTWKSTNGHQTSKPNPRNDGMVGSSAKSSSDAVKAVEAQRAARERAARDRERAARNEMAEEIHKPPLPPSQNPAGGNGSPILLQSFLPE